MFQGHGHLQLLGCGWSISQSRSAECRKGPTGTELVWAKTSLHSEYINKPELYHHHPNSPESLSIQVPVPP